MTGASEAKIAAKIEERFQVGMYKARRVVRTESNYCINQADIDRMLGDMSIEDIEQRLDMMIEEKETLPESDSTLNSAEENPLKMSVNEIGRSDVTDEYIEKAMLGTGLLTHDAGCEDGEHEDELKFAEWVHNTLGGDIHVRKEANQQNVKDPDYMWNGKLWDLKTFSTEKAANTAVQRGIDQIKHNPGSVMLDYNTNHVNLSTLELILDRRMKWYHDITADIMVVSNNVTKW